MAKYNKIKICINDGNLLNLDKLNKNQKKALESSNAIYIYRSEKPKKVYIGQTKNFLVRHKQHYSGSEEKFNNANFNSVMVIFSKYFNRSALDDVENKLITYFNADFSKATKQLVEFDTDQVINRTRGNSVNQYCNREKVDSEVLLPLWEKELYKENWVNTETINELKANELVKYSPIKVLTEEQENLIAEIINNKNCSYVINGDAGTGKTVLLTHLVAKYLNDKDDIKIGVVVQPNWEKIASSIFRVYGMNNSRLTITTATKLIRSKEKYDVIIVDESHKLSRKYSKQHPSFNSVYDMKEFSDCKSHLEIIQQLGNQIILMYDVLQAIRPANITRDMFSELTNGYVRKFLTTQFRIQASVTKNYTSDDYVNGVKYLLYKDTGLLESGFTNFDSNFNREVFRDKSPEAYFGYFKERPLYNLIEWIEEDNNYNPEHINRILAGLVEPWAQKDGKDITKKHWKEDAIERRWNSTQEDWINSKDEDAEDQIGSVFAVQGIDLNKVGVLIGRDLQVRENGKLVGNSENFFNTNGVFTKEEMEVQENKDEFTLFVLNIYYVLMTRGIDGIRLGFWHNDQLKEYMEKILEI
ncbi:DUF2075 domain-containing protein [Clostridium sp. LY3-2]|nr:DUF2075 domain-containing protein [Clostridium sp. LY3-2]MCR6516449.1 DUF2075 domain-containing protein [Clostridium sp. LY3-2]